MTEWQKADASWEDWVCDVEGQIVRLGRSLDILCTLEPSPAIKRLIKRDQSLISEFQQLLAERQRPDSN
jgi:hypothetical protein